jgi:hypothetical protein
MIEREKSALNYIKNMKRASLLKRIKRLQYKTRITFEYNNYYLVTARKREFETDVGKLVDPWCLPRFWDYHVMFSVKWHTNVYYQV